MACNPIVSACILDTAKFLDVSGNVIPCVDIRPCVFGAPVSALADPSLSAFQSLEFINDVGEEVTFSIPSPPPPVAVSEPVVMEESEVVEKDPDGATNAEKATARQQRTATAIAQARLKAAQTKMKKDPDGVTNAEKAVATRQRTATAIAQARLKAAQAKMGEKRKGGVDPKDPNVRRQKALEHLKKIKK